MVPVPARPRWPEPGQPAPDFRAGTFRLADHAGRPVVLVFFRPGGETADPALAIAEACAANPGIPSPGIANPTTSRSIECIIVLGAISIAFAARSR